jgi:hypothetical protein
VSLLDVWATKDEARGEAAKSAQSATNVASSAELDLSMPACNYFYYLHH